MKEMRTLADAQTEEEIIAFVKAAWPDESLRPNPLHHYGAWAAWIRQKIWDYCQQQFGDQISVHNFLDQLWRPVTLTLGAAAGIDDKIVWATFLETLERAPQSPTWRHYDWPMQESFRFVRCAERRTAWASNYKVYIFGPNLSAESTDSAFMQSFNQEFSPQEKNALARPGKSIQFEPPVWVKFIWQRFDSFEYRKPVSKDRRKVIEMSRKPFRDVSVPPPIILLPPAPQNQNSLDEWFPRCERCNDPLNEQGKCEKCEREVENQPKKQMSLWDT